MTGRTTVTWGGALAAALALAAVATATSGAQRWWPACPPGDLDGPACLRAQDHLHDVLPAAAQAQPLGASAPWAALALVLLCAALVLLLGAGAPGRSPGRRRSASALVGVVVAGLLVLAADTAGAGGHDRVPTALLVPAVLCWWVGLPAAWVTLVAGPSSGVAAGSPRVRRAFLTVLLLASAPAAGLLARLVYASHDTTPWVEAWSAVLLLAGAVLAVAAATGPRVRGPAPPAVPTSQQPVGG